MHLSSEHQDWVLRHLMRVLRRLDPGAFDRTARWRPGGIYERGPHLLALIRDAAGRRPGDDLSGGPDDAVCHGCMYRTPVGYCPHAPTCALRRNAATVARAIDEALRQLEQDRTPEKQP